MSLIRRNEMLRDADTGAGTGGTPGQAGSGDAGGGTPSEKPTFESWYGGLAADVKGLVDEHVSGLRTALLTERQNRTDLSKQIKDLAAKAEKGSELEKQLGETLGKLETSERRATFAEEAIRPEIGCSNVKAAYALAVAEDLFTRSGQVDWQTLKGIAPELFRKPGPGSADGGAGVNQPPRFDMNTIIRRAAGRG